MLMSTLISLVVVIGAPVQGDFFVAPNGDDGNVGSIEAPFATIGKAQEAVRALVAEGLKTDVTVRLRGGVYPLDACLVFGTEDSGTADYSITYAAYGDEKPVISGGRAITGFEKGENGEWTVELVDAKNGKWRFRQLFRGDDRLPRGRFPNADKLLTVESVNPAVTEIVFKEVPGLEKLDGKNAELVVFQNWSISRVPVVRSEGKKVVTAAPVGWIGHGSATTASPGKPAYIENVREFVDEPGEWYLDYDSGVLTYLAVPGNDPKQESFVAPKLQQLLVVKGTADKPVRNLRFEGLAFEYCGWSLPEFGYLGIQAGHHGTTMQERTHVLPLALEFTYAEDCLLSRCRVAHTGASGVGFGEGCRRNKVDRCEMFDIGGNGVMVGWRGDYLGLTGNESLSKDWPDKAMVPLNNEITNGYVHNCAAVNHGAVGVYDAFCDGTKISHNHVSNMPYTGISVGFRWNESETSQRNCIVEYNHIHDCMKMLADGGGIYTLGYQPGTVLRGNLIYSIHRSAYAHGGAPNNGIFFDQGSKGYLVEGQIIYDTSGKPIRYNQTNENNLNWGKNFLGVLPDSSEFPEDLAKQAGPEAE